MLVLLLIYIFFSVSLSEIHITSTEHQCLSHPDKYQHVNIKKAVAWQRQLEEVGDKASKTILTRSCGGIWRDIRWTACEITSDRYKHWCCSTQHLWQSFQQADWFGQHEASGVRVVSLRGAHCRVHSAMWLNRSKWIEQECNIFFSLLSEMYIRIELTRLFWSGQINRSDNNNLFLAHVVVDNLFNISWLILGLLRQ